MAASFHIPGRTPDEQEAIYMKMAEQVRLPVPLHGQRISSIIFQHNGDIWTATVGQQLHGRRTSGRRGHEREVPLSDPATVLAIFPGNPYFVFTDKGPYLGNARSMWENPFMAGQPLHIDCFDSDQTTR